MTKLAPLTIGGIPIIGDILEASGELATGFFMAGLKFFAEKISETLNSIVVEIYAGFMRVNTPGVGDENANPFDQSGKFIGTADWTNKHLLWLSVFVATVGIAVAGGKLAWSYTHGYHEGLRNVLSGLVTMVIANLLVVQAVRVLLWIGDRYSEWIISQSKYEGGQDLWADFQAIERSGQLVLLFILLGSFVLLSVLIQLVLLMFRGAVLTLLAGTIVLPAASATTETGRRWLNKYLSWMLAFICMKPAAATIYAVAFKLLYPLGEADGLSAVISGMVLLGAAVFILPALLRLLTPVGVALAGSAVAASSGSGGQQGSGSAPQGSSEPAQGGVGDTQGSPSSGRGGLTNGPSGASMSETGKSAGVGGGSGGAGGGMGTASTSGGSGASTAATAGAAGAATGGVGAVVAGAAEGAKNTAHRVGYEVENEGASADRQSGEGPVGAKGTDQS